MKPELKSMTIGENKLQRSKLIEILEQYPMLDSKIALRKLELKYPYSEADDNIGGGKSDNGNGIEKSEINQIAVIDEDEELIRLTMWKNCIERALTKCKPLDDSARDTTRELVNLMYFDDKQFTIPWISKHRLIPLSETSLRQKNKVFLNILGNLLS